MAGTGKALLNAFMLVLEIVGVFIALEITMMVGLVIIGLVAGVVLTISGIHPGVNVSINNTVNNISTLVTSINSSVTTLMGFIVLAAILVLFANYMHKPKAGAAKKSGVNTGGQVF